MNILITGTSRGIGFEVVKLLAANHSVYALSSNAKKLSEQTGSLDINIIQFDFLKQTINSILPLLPETIDILINNAGTLINKPFEQITDKDIEKTIAVNFTTPMLLIQSVVDRLYKSKVKHIVNISSIGGFQGSQKFPGLSIYSASKGALAVLTECLATEYQDKNIRFNCLALGSVQTEMFEKAFPNVTASLKPGEVAQYVADFALNQWKYFNGQIIPVRSSNI